MVTYRIVAYILAAGIYMIVTGVLLGYRPRSARVLGLATLGWAAACISLTLLVLDRIEQITIEAQAAEILWTVAATFVLGGAVVLLLWVLGVLPPGSNGKDESDESSR